MTTGREPLGDDGRAATAPVDLHTLTLGFAAAVRRFVGYQILAAALLAVVVMPLFHWSVGQLIRSSGREAISSGDYLAFLLSPQGIGVLLVGALVFAFVILVDIGGTILIAADARLGRPYPGTWAMLGRALAQARSFAHPAGLLILAYVGLVVPLSGVGLGVSALSGLRIPNFVTSVIYDNPLYLAAYTAAVVVLAILGALGVFVFHFVLLCGTGVWAGMRASGRLIRTHARAFFLGLLPRMLLLAGALVLVTVVFLLVATLPGALLPSGTFAARFVLVLGLLLAAVVIGVGGFVLTPFVLYALTAFFLSVVPADRLVARLSAEPAHGGASADRRPRRGRRGWRAGIAAGLVAVVAVAAALSALVAANFDDVFTRERPLEIVAHRGGGDLAPENSVAGVDAAAAVHAAFSEFDVQRTADGTYVIQHDPTFARVTGDPHTPQELTLAQIRGLRIRNAFGTAPATAPVPTAQEMLDAGKRDRIGMFVELKGASADRQMADDVAAMIRERGMQQQAVLLTLDYDLARYIEQKHPDLKVGYLFYFSVGETERLAGNYLIMEEDAATDERIAAVHAAGKKAVVWTVNTPESIEKFLDTDADAVITDHVRAVQQAEAERGHRDDVQAVVDTLLAG